MGEGIEYNSSTEVQFANLLSNKFNLFKQLLYETLHDNEKSMQFNPEEVKRILIYGKNTYFKHLRLYDYVLNNK